MPKKIPNLFSLPMGVIVAMVLAGCAEVAVVGIGNLVNPMWVPDAFGWTEPKRTNYYEPTILVATEGEIQIRYLSTGPNARHEEVVKIIAKNCHSSYLETSREELRGWTTVNAVCVKEAHPEKFDSGS